MVRLELGATLATDRVVPSGRATPRSLSIPARLLGLAHVALAAVVAVASIGLAASARPEPGIATGEPGSDVVWVFPGGPSWRDGLRSGQRVVALESGVNVGTWRVATTDGRFSYATSYERHENVLRETFPTALLAAALGALALLFITRLAASTALATGSVMLSAIVVAATGYPVLSSVVLVWMLLAPVAWLVLWRLRSTRLQMALLGAVIVIAGAWLFARYGAPELFDAADLVRRSVAGTGSLLMLVLLVDWRHWRKQLLGVDSRRAVDLVSAVLILGLAVLLALLLELPLVLLVAIVIAAAVSYPRFRRRLASVIDQLVLGEVRDRASITAVEEERGRIARDLHDAPLQEIAAVIRQLDRRPGTAAETELLRGVADRLRRVTTELRPPILDDLGLHAAIAYVADEVTAAAPELRVELALLPEDPLGDRAPAEVELAVFRIVQEAVDNALRHAGGDHLRISGLVLPDEVVAEVEDNGTGIREASARAAARAGHLGLVSMEQRARLIGAEFAVDAVRPHGTRVRVAWRRKP